ncbi:epoxide hydrolase family protein [Sporobolomyces salmoneus]|uniref:epoxide hydrolase family protein n=1 Tax=Sporobolomyces salmoneus TaxID=183962 RepID=UPI003170F97E
MSPQRTIDIEQFRPVFTDSELDGLRQTLQHSRLPTRTFASNQERYGITYDFMETALARWKNGFDWKKKEEQINSVHHYYADVEDGGTNFKIHFIYEESKDPNAIPLLLLHGWPGSAFEFIDAIKLLRESSSPSFHLIAPMEPGYGWSSPPPLDRGFGTDDVASIMHSLMCSLGFENGYAIQGGDIGSLLARKMALKYESVKCIHLNYLPAVEPEDGSLKKQVKPHEQRSLNRSEEFQKTGRAYALAHGTRPGTIGFTVGSSPISLLAWLAEKYRDWTDETPSVDEILAIATFWWLRDSFPSSIYAYHELLFSGVSFIHNDQANYLHKPFGYSAFKQEISCTPEAWVGVNGNCQFYRYNDKGGHFPSMEQPEQFAKDMKDCFGKIWVPDT